MSGHSKWSTIKHKKAATDAKRGQLFTKMAKLISVAVKEAGGDPHHPAVVAAVEQAKKYSVPKENIERAIAKGSEKNTEGMERVTYEGYGPGGVGFIIEAVTDNRNRTGQEVKHAFSQAGSAMGVPGSVSWGFEKTKEGGWTPQPGTEIPLDPPTMGSVEQFVASLENLDDVTAVYLNAKA